MLDKLLLWARNMEASDLHIRPASVPMVRVDGSLQPLQNEFISREKLEQALLALLPEQEKRQLLQTGNILRQTFLRPLQLLRARHEVY